MPLRIGHGFDVHRLKKGETLIIGGKTIPWEKGTVAHSDGDVLLHAISDALLGALALGDIGTHFPDTDARYKNADSLSLLKEVASMVDKKGYRIQNIDTTMMLQHPKLKNHIPDMQLNIANCLNIERTQVSIKATTTEKLGFIGREEGVAAEAVVLLSS